MPTIGSKQRRRWFEGICRERGLPVTIQRRVVFEVLAQRKDHPTADQICEEVRSRHPGISRTTIYRILDTFVAAGLVSRICHPGSAARFDPKVNRHDHLVCLHCEKIIDIEDERLGRIPWPDVSRHGFQINDYHIHFRGLCLQCRRKLKQRKKVVRGSRKRGTVKSARVLSGRAAKKARRR